MTGSNMLQRGDVENAQPLRAQDCRRHGARKALDPRKKKRAAALEPSQLDQLLHPPSPENAHRDVNRDRASQASPGAAVAIVFDSEEPFAMARERART